MGRVAYVNGRFVPHADAYVHIEDQNDGPGLLLVEVNNGGEHEHPRSASDGAAA